MLHENSLKIRPKYHCEKCDYSCSKKSDFNKHIKSKKHNATYEAKNATINSLTCKCGKKYKHHSSFYRHKNICLFEEKLEEKLEENNNIDYKDMFIEMMKENRELHKTIHEIIPKIGNTTNNTTNTTNNNQQLNLNLFLNEQCKDALNITDFVRSLEVNMNDLVQTGKLGYVEGISRIFVKALKDMDVTERPIHCTDIKREIVYIKDQDKWEKDENNKEKIKKTIRNIENKNLKMLPQWQEDNPDCMNMESKKSEEFMELSINALGGNDDKDVSEKKIMKNILKEVVLDKNNL
jgi:hypothetical protein